MQKTVLLLGGINYLGVHLADKFLSCDYNVIIIDKISHEDLLIYLQRKHQKCVEFHNIDVSVDNIPTFDKQIDIVIYMIDIVDVYEANLNPVDCIQKNIQTLLKCVQYCKNNRIYNFHYKSSGAVYGIGENHKESDLISKNNDIFSETKLLCERVLLSLSNSTFKVTILRFFQVVGIPDVRMGVYLYYKQQNEEFLPMLSKNCQNDFAKIVIYGSNYKTKDGTIQRDYIHITDVCNLYIKILEQPEISIPVYDIYNICSGELTSNLELTHMIAQLHNFYLKDSQFTIEYGDNIRTELDYYSGSKEKTNSTFSWNPFTSIEEIVRDYWNLSRAFEKEAFLNIKYVKQNSPKKHRSIRFSLKRLKTKKFLK